MLSVCLVIQHCLRGTPLGFFYRIIVNKTPLNLEKTTYSVLSVLLLICDNTQVFRAFQSEISNQCFT